MAELSQCQKSTRHHHERGGEIVQTGGIREATCIWMGVAILHYTKKDRTIHFLSDFWEVNKRLVRKPFPIPKISMVLQEIEGFTFATALDLNMDYYTIRLDPDASKICTIIFPWGKYSYKRLPMVLQVLQTFSKERCRSW
jgi:hypothetical protein